MNTRMFPYAARFLLLIACIMPLCLVSACSGRIGLDGEMATPYHVRYDAAVKRKPPAVYVRPNLSPDAPPTALFVPLRLMQNSNSFQTISRNVSRQIWQVWLSQQAFSTLDFDDATVYGKVQDALPLARQKGAQLLVGGYIQHIYDGGTAGDSTLSLNMEIYDVASGILLWSLSQAGAIEKKQAMDFFLVGVQERMPADPMGLLIRTLAYDMGKEVLYWVNPHAKKTVLPFGRGF